MSSEPKTPGEAAHCASGLDVLRAERDALAKELENERAWRKACQVACGATEDDREQLLRFFVERTRERDALAARVARYEEALGKIKNGACHDPDYTYDADGDEEAVACECCMNVADAARAALEKKP